MVKVSQTAQTLHPEASLISITNTSHVSLLFKGEPESKWRQCLLDQAANFLLVSQPLFLLFFWQDAFPFWFHTPLTAQTKLYN